MNAPTPRPCWVLAPAAAGVARKVAAAAAAGEAAMPTARYRGPPMTLAKMCRNGMRPLAVRCEVSHHEAVINADAYDESIAIPSFGPRMVCISCGMVGADARPNWQERPRAGSLASGLPSPIKRA
jgi:hypothetical protein